MNDVTNSLPLPQTEGEVIATVDDDGGDRRKWVKLTYDFHDKLCKLGGFLYKIACDVEQAGGWVTQISLGTGIQPANERPDDRRPHGKWRAMYVEVSIKTQAEVNAWNEAWDAAVRDLVGKYKRS